MIDGGVQMRHSGRRQYRMAQRSAGSRMPSRETYMAVLKQSRSAWSLEVEVRPWVEKF